MVLLSSDLPETSYLMSCSVYWLYRPCLWHIHNPHITVTFKNGPEFSKKSLDKTWNRSHNKQCEICISSVNQINYNADFILQKRDLTFG
jgi:hypothetical protein